MQIRYSLNKSFAPRTPLTARDGAGGAARVAVHGRALGTGPNTEVPGATLITPVTATDSHTQSAVAYFSHSTHTSCSREPAHYGVWSYSMGAIHTGSKRTPTTPLCFRVLRVTHAEPRSDFRTHHRSKIVRKTWRDDRERPPGRSRIPSHELYLENV